MARAEQEALVVPFGTDRWSLAEIHAGTAERPLRASAPFPCLLLPPGFAAPLRLNSIPLDLFASANAPIDRGDPLATLYNQVLALCDPWNHSATTFIGRYFQAAEVHVMAQAPAIAAGSFGCGSLFTPRDWVYSVPCPLPRAHLRAPGGPGHSAEDAYVAVDVAFWSGSGFVAVDTAPPRLLPKAAGERRHRLAAAGIELIAKAPANDDPAAWSAFFASLLAPPLTAFWQGETIPLGCFRSDALDALDGMVLRH